MMFLLKKTLPSIRPKSSLRNKYNSYYYKYHNYFYFHGGAYFPNTLIISTSSQSCIDLENHKHHNHVRLLKQEEQLKKKHSVAWNESVLHVHKKKFSEVRKR